MEIYGPPILIFNVSFFGEFVNKINFTSRILFFTQILSENPDL